ncbi:MAG TPA: oligosaccharide flippase family protein [Gammaproteobacteria bacterium]
MRDVLARRIGLPGGRLARNTIHTMFWQAVRLAALVAWVIVVARALGPVGYGDLAGVTGLAVAIAGLAGFGIGLVMYEDVAVERSRFGFRWRSTLIAYSLSGILLLAVYLVTANLMFPEFGNWPLLAIGLGEVAFFPIVGAAAHAFGAHERMGVSAALPAVAAGGRLLATIVFVVSDPSPTVTDYVVYHLLSAGGAAAVSLGAVRVMLRPPKERRSLTAGDVREGLKFTGVWFTGSALTSLDKAIVLRLAGSETAGLYASAYRVAMVLVMPIDSLIIAALPRLFQRRHAPERHPALLRSLSAAILVYGCASALVLCLAAELVSRVLGPDFGSMVSAARWLSLLIPLYGLRQLGAQLLVAEGFRSQRMLLDTIGLMVMIVSGALLLPRWNLTGAVLMILLVETLLLILVWAFIAVVLRRGAIQAGGPLEERP